MKKSAKEAPETRYPSKRVKCPYCKCAFNTPPTYNGSTQKFCKPAHRKAFDKEGEKPIDVILRKQERRMREIARENGTESRRSLRVAAIRLAYSLWISGISGEL